MVCNDPMIVLRMVPYGRMMTPLSDTGTNKRYALHCGDALDAYHDWVAPDLIISDGAYGVNGFNGDTHGPDGLPGWYEPHIAAWSECAKPSTSLWFWNTEIGWATMHPLLDSYGWDYVQLVTWDKGLAHIAGNVNGRTIRQFPVVTEVSALYRRRLMLQTVDGGSLGVQQWLREEWQRSGLPLNQANDACGVKNAATRKYLTADMHWYWPPGDMVIKMSVYAMANGTLTNRPYFSIDGHSMVTAEQWDSMRATWNHVNGVTNVWPHAPTGTSERVMSSETGRSAAHPNQKPLDLMMQQIAATTNPNDVVWEPFGGLASGSVAAVMMGRTARVAETSPGFAALALTRLEQADALIRCSS